MRILITGGKGYIARNLKPLLENAGHEVVAPSRTEMDMTNSDSVLEYADDTEIEAVIHTAVKGGKRGYKDDYTDFLANITMYENLSLFSPYIPVIIFGSGAEFDRRHHIQEAREADMFNSWPIDPYGLAKNLISRRSLWEHKNFWILRLFGCFNEDEDTTRFIKAGILNMKRGLPVEVHKDLKMDFFYMDDVFTVVNHVLTNPTAPRHINLSYVWKINLIGVARLITQHSNVPALIKLKDINIGNDYTGNGDILESLNLPLIGLEEGIRRTFNKLT